MSGGVDSSVAGALLKERDFDVRGVHIKMWSPNQNANAFGTGQADPLAHVCKQQYQDRIDAMRVAAKLDIPFETWDFTEEYRKAVVEYMVREYAEGRTPNPDVMCNREIKFGVFLKRAVENGADFIATGHYVRLATSNLGIGYSERPLNPSGYTLMAARDAQKDQSYFLWELKQEQLERSLFPIGEYAKPEVRELARKFDLPTAEKKDSQGLCFIGKIDVGKFLKDYIPETRGEILTTAGKIVGEHAGLEFYTIGQRHGIGIGGGTPYYVTAKDFTANRLIVAEGDSDKNLYKNELAANKINWISGNNPAFPLECEARIRYRQPLQKCRVLKVEGSRDCNLYPTLHVQFTKPQRAVASGQSVVFYKDDEMLGGAIII